MKFCIDLNNCQGTYQKCILQDRNFVASFQPQLQSNSDKRMNYRNDQSPEGLEIYTCCSPLVTLSFLSLLTHTKETQLFTLQNLIFFILINHENLVRNLCMSLQECEGGLYRK